MLGHDDSFLYQKYNWRTINFAPIFKLDLSVSWFMSNFSTNKFVKLSLKRNWGVRWNVFFLTFFIYLKLDLITEALYRLQLDKLRNLWYVILLFWLLMPKLHLWRGDRPLYVVHTRNFLKQMKRGFYKGLQHSCSGKLVVRH